MRIAEGAEALDLVMHLWGGDLEIHPTLLWDEEGATLVDAGMPTHSADILARLTELGLQPTDLKRIILTHQDVDHIGGARDIAGATGARVYAHAADRPYIEGERQIIKLEPARSAARVQALPTSEQALMNALIARPPSVGVDELVSDGQELPFHGGLTMIHTPGHTPGHVAVYVKAHRLLLAGDALRVEDGALLGPNPVNTLDMGEATASLKKFLTHPIEHVFCFHGGLYGPRASARLAVLAGA